MSEISMRRRCTTEIADCELRIAQLTRLFENPQSAIANPQSQLFLSARMLPLLPENHCPVHFQRVDD
jgi:hypothetical protein